MKAIFCLLAWASKVLSLDVSNPNVKPPAVCTLSASGGDDGPTFVSAIKQCSTVTIPDGVTLNISTRMDMTGLINKSIILDGTVAFNPNIAYWTENAFTIPFQNSLAFWQFGGQNVQLLGSGTLDGQGQPWWEAFNKNSSLLRPILLHTFNAEGAVIRNIKMINSPIWFNLIDGSSNVTFDNINITAKSTGSGGIPNTDGWDTYRSDHVVIQNSVITNGDDCVSFKPNSTNILVSNLTCTGSHGISVGSLGQYSGVYDIVQNILATDIKMISTENGARIKAWAGSGVGSGLVKNVTFQDFQVSKVSSPITIDQCYETSTSACEQNPSNTLIQDVWFNNFTGTASSSTVATLSCSPDARCSDININDFFVKPSSGSAKYSCENTVLSGNSASLFGTCSTT